MLLKTLAVKDLLVNILINSLKQIYKFSKKLYCLDLADVQSVAPAPPAAIGTKKVDEKAFFDVSFIFFLSCEPLLCTFVGYEPIAHGMSKIIYIHVFAMCTQKCP